MIEPLFKSPEKFNFFQAVRLLQRHARDAGRNGAEVGYDHPPADEAVRFRALPALSFPGSDVASLHERDGQLEMEVAFMGLIGPNGVLPEHYTRLVLEQLRARDDAMRDFWDLFQHRLISLFYRAWEKHHVPSQFLLQTAPGSDPADATAPGGRPADTVFTKALFSMSGMGNRAVRDRQAVPDQVFLFYAGAFASQRRPADSLQRMLSEYFGESIGIQPFVGQWLRLEDHNRSRLPSRLDDAVTHNMLGEGLVLGERVWDTQGKFRIQVGPLRLAKFEQFLPIGSALGPLFDLARAYAGTEFDFDVQLILRAEEIPACRLGATEGQQDRRHEYAGTRLGWNAWLGGATSGEHASDAVFSVSQRNARWRKAAG
ncbi:MAG: type VI secretion system baseplate subunit TssG [Planctomycetales bacterium]|nr:type VI secretion system baseplate subunit TssG [Planctomycetales bacterium]